MSWRENNGGPNGLQEIAEQDAQRAFDAATRRAQTLRRRGNKGARVWGFQELGGKRQGRRS